MLFNRFFSVIGTCLSCEDIARLSCVMVPRWRIFGDFSRPVFTTSRAQHVSDLHPKFTARHSSSGRQAKLCGVEHTMCGSMVDIQSATAEIRRGKKES